ncbi:MAG: DUF2846 domain-containing protein [Urechidicola sp.]|nr:DUF2846 domain-containing protein [Urechidicola sp.]
MYSKKAIQTMCVFLFTLLLSTNFAAFAQKIPEVEEGKGLVIFYRSKKFSGSAIKFTVKDNRGEYGQLTNGSIIYITVEPGSNTFWSQVISSDSITIDVEEGKTYYVKGTTKMGAVAGRPKFNLVDEKKALKEIKKLQ